MAVTEKHPCAGKVWTSYLDYPCQKPAKYQEGGKWWCGTHAPSKVEARAAARLDKYQAERNRQNEALRQAERRAAELTEKLGVRVSTSQHFTNRVVGYRLVLADEYIPVPR